MSLLLRVLSGLALTARIAASFAASAQEPPTSPVPAAPASEAAVAPQPSPEPVRITVADLELQVEATRRSLRKIEDAAARGHAPPDIERRLHETERGVEALRAERKTLDLDRLSLHGFEELQQKIARIGQRTAEWRAVLDARVAELTEADTELDRAQQAWQATLGGLAPDEQVPDLVVEQGREVERGLVARRAELDDRLATVVELRGRLGDVDYALDRLSAEIADARERARKRLLVPENPPLWGLFATPATGSFREQIRTEWERDREGFDEFRDEYGARAVFQVALFVVLAALLVGLHRRSRRWSVAPEDPALRPALRIFSMPFSAALLVTLLFTRAFYPHAPQVIFDLAGLLGLVPLLRLIPRLVYARLRPAIYAVGGLFALHQLRELVPPQTLLERLMLLLLSGLALVVALRVARTLAREPGTSRLRSAATLAIRLGALLLALGSLANVLGAVSLADILTSGTLASAYLGIAVFAGVLVVDALVLVALRSTWARAAGTFARHGELIHARTARLFGVLGLAIWITATLRWFSLLDPVMRGVRAALAEHWTVGKLQFSIGALVTFCLALGLAVLASRCTRFVLDEDVYPRVALPRGVPDTLSMLLHYAILGLGLIFALVAAGIEVGQFALLAGALGVGIGFGLQNVVNNFISGLILVFERPIKIGDTIEVGQLVGEVRRIGIRSSAVRTGDGAEVIVPNANLIAAEVINWTLSDRVRRIKIPVGVAYGTEPQQVIELLVRAAEQHGDVLRQPRPNALFVRFGESTLDFELRFWTANFDFWPVVQSDVALAVHAALVRAGIAIPFPQRDLHLRSVDRGAERALREAAGPASPLESSTEGH